MLNRSDFTTPEWQTLNNAVWGSARYVSLAENEGVFDDLLENGVVSDSLQRVSHLIDSQLINDLINHGLPKKMSKHFKRSFESIEVPVMQDIEKSVTILYEKDKKELEAFRYLILDIVKEVAEKVEGISKTESNAYAKVYAKVMADPKPPEKKEFFGDL